MGSGAEGWERLLSTLGHDFPFKGYIVHCLAVSPLPLRLCCTASLWLGLTPVMMQAYLSLRGHLGEDGGARYYPVPAPTLLGLRFAALPLLVQHL